MADAESRVPPGAVPDPWDHLKAHTDARIAPGHAGVSLPTRAHLAFQLAHARARDAVETSLDVQALAAALSRLPVPQVVQVHSAAPDRATYLRRPDLGRVPDQASRAALQALRGEFPPADLALAVCDGLSSRAIATNALPFLEAFLPLWHDAGGTLAPLAIALQARVALGDEVADLLGARAVAVLVGERPGLSSPDSMGIYLTWKPRPGMTRDDGRNCISNIRPAGMSCADGAAKLLWLLDRARQIDATGVTLKDEQALPPKSLDSP